MLRNRQYPSRNKRNAQSSFVQRCTEEGSKLGDVKMCLSMTVSYSTQQMVIEFRDQRVTLNHLSIAEFNQLCRERVMVAQHSDYELRRTSLHHMSVVQLQQLCFGGHEKMAVTISDVVVVLARCKTHQEFTCVNPDGQVQ